MLGPWLVTADEIADPDKLNFSINVGDDERQNSNTDKLIFDCKLIEYGSGFYTLYPGDVIMTRAPEGVGLVEPVTPCIAIARALAGWMWLFALPEPLG